MSRFFDSELHKMVRSEDGSFTAYSNEYEEHYHSTKDGALKESLAKHVEPALKIKKELFEINILDICFGLGFNTLSTLYYHKKNSLTSKINIFSPELDASLVKSLNSFSYPQEFEELKEVIFGLVRDGMYQDENFHVELFLGDTKEYIKSFEDEKFDIVFQDAFSPLKNRELWTKEYFGEIKRVMKKDAVLTTYSTALPVRLGLYENGFHLYVNSGDGFRDSTIASFCDLDGFKKVNMEHKIKCNPHVKYF